MVGGAVIMDAVNSIESTEKKELLTVQIGQVVKKLWSAE